VLDRLVTDMAQAIERIDASRPVPRCTRPQQIARGFQYSTGMGSHSEPQHVAILTQALLTADPTWYLSIEGEIRYSDYVGDPRRCDLRITTPLGSVLVEVKLLWQSN
jgi:hypothetical protein